MKIIIALDSFKECLTSQEAGEAAARGIHKVFPSCEVVRFSIADGGEGMLDALISATGGKRLFLRAHNPMMEMHDTCYGISNDRQTAFIEMAAISGLPLVPKEKRNPMLTTSYGTGELICHALNLGCRNFIIGLGGSATNDAGLGMLQALGFRFLDETGANIIQAVAPDIPKRGMCGELLAKVASIDSSAAHPALKNAKFVAACDVKNPFTGPKGASFVFAPQKGADREMAAKLDANMKKLAGIISQSTGKDISNIPGSGAAGGMGGSLLAFLHADLKPGIQLLLDFFHFTEKIKGADLIITGEGKADRQTIMGKVPSGILQEAQKQQIPVILLAGKIEDKEMLEKAGFKEVLSINPTSVPQEKAMESAFAKTNIRRTVEEICRKMI
ncbi:glycerate kinase [Bacteroides zoogleoformans]|uniref:Glycerate kinase n=1 Tax=Bacteroides zoogleoformans TaxID=28119 RepID=A0ABM6T4Y3_9BACE|nr:glycerate kinase [Bacteroides zoogleoformans]AVM51729.1 glycerate kinase [Bacteroides zoogleoformans]TWJ13844.1 glycerate kinase [Bacteroides zoogleoformans]